MKVLLAAGGSAGHVEPALTLADTLLDDDSSVEIVALGTERGIESTLVPERGYRLITVPAYPFPRRMNRRTLTAPVRIGGSIRKVTEVLRREQPDVVVGFGGYVAFPAYVAARRLGIPIVVHEANAHPGLADRVGARLTPWVAVNTAGVLPSAAHIGMPLRKSIRDLASMSLEERAAARAAARLHLGLAADRRTLLVFGGSLGARHINATMAQASDDLAAANIQVVHIVGSAGQGLPDDWPPERAADQPAYVSLSYLAAMHEAFAAADAVVCRAGAMTCAEVSAVGLPAVYVPLPVGNGEQTLNARPVVDAGGGVLVDDADFEVEAVRGQVIPLVTDVERCEVMSAKARRFAIVDADERLADLVRAAAALRGRTKRSAKVDAP